ncbi:hypothetical protein [Exiguobacterium artemiae]
MKVLINFNQYIQKKEDNIYNKFILDQFKIDTFLKSANGIEKYFTLTSFWDDHNDSEIYVKLNELNKNVNIEHKNIIKEIKILSDKIKKMSASEDVLRTLNSIISKVNNKNIRNVHLESLTNDNMNNFIEHLTGEKVKVQIIKNEVEKNSEILSSVIENWDEYLNNKLLYQKSNQLIKKLFKDLNKLYSSKKLLNDLKDELKKLNIKLKNNNDAHTKHLFLKKTLPEFKLLYQENQRNLIISEEKSEIIKNIKNDLLKENKDYKKSRENLSKIENEILEINKKLDKIPKYYNGFNSFKLNEKHLENRILVLKNLIEIREEKVNSLLTVSENLNSTYDLLEKNYENFFGFIKNMNEVNFELEVVSLSSALKKLNLLKIKEDSIKKELFEELKFNDFVKEFIIHGRTIIQEDKRNHCILCNAEYENYKVLLEKIDSKITNNDHHSLKQNLDNVELEIELTKKMIKDLENKIKTKIDLNKKILALN